MTAGRWFLTALCRLLLKGVEEGLGAATSNDADCNNHIYLLNPINCY